jgi:uncharacterized protein YndB with AHSA1/START domain
MFVIEIDINRAPELVFGRLARAEDTPRWYSAVQRVDQVANSPPGLGARYRFTRELPSGPTVNEVEVTEYQQPTVYTLKSRSGPTPFTYRYVLAPNAAGGTRLRLEGEISGEGIGGPLALLAPLASKLFERGMRTNLASFKRLVEGSTS